MSEHYTGSEPGQQPDARSSVKLARNAKGDTQIEVKVRVGDTVTEVDAAKQIALATYQQLERDLAGARR